LEKNEITDLFFGNIDRFNFYEKEGIIHYKWWKQENFNDILGNGREYG